MSISRLTFSFDSSGWLYVYHLGVAHYLQRHVLPHLEAERVARVAAARRAEEQRLEEAARLESILAENAERAAAEQRKRAEEIGQQRKERELELAMLHRARAKPNS